MQVEKPIQRLDGQKLNAIELRGMSAGGPDSDLPRDVLLGDDAQSSPGEHLVDFGGGPRRAK